MRIVNVFVCVILSILLVEGVSWETCEPLYNAIVKHKEVILDYVGLASTGIIEPDRFRLAGLRHIKERLGVDFDNNTDLKQFICRVKAAEDFMGLATRLGVRDEQLVQIYNNTNLISDQLSFLVNATVLSSVYMGWEIATGFPNFPLGITYDKMLSSYGKLLETYFNMRLSEQQLAPYVKAYTESQSLADYEKATGYSDIEQGVEIRRFNFKAWPGRIVAYIDIITAVRESGLFDLPLNQQGTDGQN